MSIWSTFTGLFAARVAAGPAPDAPAAAVPISPPPQLTAKPLNISDETLAFLRSSNGSILYKRLDGKGPSHPFTGLPTPPPGVRPEKDPVPKGMAMDDVGQFGGGTLGVGGIGGAWGAWATSSLYGEGLWFPGYPYLAELAQRPEYRNISETVAEEMTRKWIKLTSTGKDDKTEKIKKLEAAMKRFNLREAFNRGMELDGFMGIGLIYIDIKGATDDPEELAKPLLIDKGKIGRGSLLGFTPVDPTWVSPVQYNSTDPLKPDYFRPSVWYVMSKQVHVSRLLMIRSREVPDILKAAYNFGGLSLSQMAKPYMDNWLRTRQSVSDLVHAFSVFTLKTGLLSLLADANEMMKRMAAFVLGRDNKGLMLIDKETEDLTNTSVPLGTLDHLQAQAQEQMASVSQIPIIKLTGITPTGLNATTDGEIRVWYDRVKAKQEKTFGAPLTIALQVLQLNEFGEVDDSIGFEFQPLWELDDAGRAAVQKTQADTAAVLIQEGVIDNSEERKRQASDPASPYHGLEGPAPEMPDPSGEEPDKADVTGRIEKEGAEGGETEANSGV